MKNGDAIRILSHQDKNVVGRIGFLVQFEKEDEKWIVQLPEGRLLVSESDLEILRSPDATV